MNRKLAMLTVILLLMAGIVGALALGATIYKDKTNTKQVAYAPTQEEVNRRAQEEASRGIGQRNREEEENRRRAEEAEANRIEAAKVAERQREEAERSDGRYTLRVQVTAYTADEPGDTGLAYDGRPAIAYHTMAVDPDVIPLGSKVYVPGHGWFLAHDTGGAVKGPIVDMRLGNHNEAIKWGRRTLVVTVVPPKTKYKMAW